MRDETSAPSAIPAASDSSRKRLVLPPLLNGLLIGYAALMLAGGWAYSALHIRVDRERTLQAERDRLLTVASAVETGAAAMLNDGVGAAVAGARELGFFGDPELRDATIRSTLEKMLTGGQYVRSLFLIAPDRFARVGRSHYESDRRPPPWFSAKGSPALPDTWVGDPIPDPEPPHQTVIPIARQVQLAGHRYVWAGGLFDFRTKDALYARFEGSLSALVLLSSEGTVLMFIPGVTRPQVAVGTDLSDSPLFQAAPRSSQSGIVEGFGPRYGRQILLAYHRLGDYPITVVTGETVETLLTGWRERTRTALAVTIGSSALLLLMTGLLDHAVRVLRRRELHYRTLFNSATFSVLLLEDDRFIAANDTVLRMFGLGPGGKAIGLTPWQLSPLHQPDGRPSEEAAREHIAAALHQGGTTFEWLHKRLDTGESFPAQVDLSTLKTGRTTLALAVVHDLTERKRAERELRTLAGELMRVQDQERRRIGRDLHDSTGQTLTALELDLARLIDGVQQLSPEQATRLARCVKLASQCAAEIRSASYLLHPPLLDELGLVSALRWLADGLRQRNNIEIRLDLPDTGTRWEPEDELTLFRVAQEALTNVLRHAQSPSVAIRLIADAQEIRLEIEDAGRGFGHAHSRAGYGAYASVGLTGMRERIRQIGGTFRVESTGAGTLITACLRARLQPPGARGAT